MSNLVQICEEVDGNKEEDEISTSSDEADLDNPQILSEVRATMAVGAALNINFLPNDERILKKMVCLENKEAEASRDKLRATNG